MMTSRREKIINYFCLFLFFMGAVVGKRPQEGLWYFFDNISFFGYGTGLYLGFYIARAFGVQR